MPDYRRAWHPGGTYFFTVNLLNRRDNDLLTRHIDALRETVRRVKLRHAFNKRLFHRYVLFLAKPLTTRACRPTTGYRQRLMVKEPFKIHGWVVLPDHLHCVIELPPGDADFATRWRLIKMGFSKSLPRHEVSRRCARHAESGESGNGGIGNI